MIKKFPYHHEMPQEDCGRCCWAKVNHMGLECGKGHKVHNPFIFEWFPAITPCKDYKDDTESHEL